MVSSEHYKQIEYFKYLIKVIKKTLIQFKLYNISIFLNIFIFKPYIYK